MTERFPTEGFNFGPQLITKLFEIIDNGTSPLISVSSDVSKKTQPPDPPTVSGSTTDQKGRRKSSPDKMYKERSKESLHKEPPTPSGSSHAQAGDGTFITVKYVSRCGQGVLHLQGI